MLRLLLGVVLASLVGFLWGMIYWGVSPLPYRAWKQSTDDVAAGRALLEHFPEVGTYYLPAMHHEPEKLSDLFESGPIAFVHLTSVDGRSMQDPPIMIQGFALILISCLLLATILRIALPATPTYGERVQLVALVGLAAALVIDIGDVVWWQLPLDWKLYQAFYDFTAFLVPGLVLAWLVTPGITEFSEISELG